MTSTVCRARTPSLCRVHGIPHPSLSSSVVKAEMKALKGEMKTLIHAGKSEEAKLAESAYMQKLYRLAALEPKARFRRKFKWDDLVGIGEQMSAMEQEVADYKLEALKQILGEDSIEYKTYVRDVVKELGENSEGFDVFDMQTIEPDQPFYEWKQAINAEVIKKAEVYAQQSGADGVVVVQKSKYIWKAVPYKLKPGQITVAAKESVMNSERFLSASNEIDKVTMSMRKGKPSRIVE